MKLRETYLLRVLIVLVLCYSTDSLTCINENGKNVDWFITYKLPKVKGSPNQHYRTGVGYSYFGQQSTEWTTSLNSINDSISAVGRTIAELYENNSELAYVLYNDQAPNAPPTDNNGHTKGILMTTKTGGIWLQHSVPHFPEPGKTYQYPKTGTTNGQVFLCLSLTIKQVDSIGEILQYTKPNVFNYSIPDSFSDLLPTLEKVVKRGKFRRSPPWFKIFTLSTSSLTFQIFAKGPKFQEEIYADWIAPKLQTSLEVQSWLNGANPLASNCTSPNYPTYNVLLKNIVGQDFSTHNDHSKWAVGNDTANPWVCIADLNRMEHQLKRGGAALCTTYGGIFDVFRSSIETLQPCPAPAVLNNERQK